ncbi:cytochrome b561, eukaryote [Cynara cardunculus var. scolymus]|uniref:Cytochrome b561, eukaryote n=1 Tax=Cynara cardunculus var. scolymus TaxID=59895 RepID=A0A103YJ77_CYNCS|nr:cytochrome b561, eukaryote [Cynara cardunculus var. scolymus]
MGLEIKALYLSYVVHVLGVAGAVMVLVWNIYFRGGLAWESSNKNLIFNAEKKLIHLVLHAIALILGSIGIYMAFKNHNESGLANLYSLHSWLGIAVANSALGFLEKLTFLESSGIDKYGSEAFLVNFTAIVAVLYGTFVLLTALSRAPAEDDNSYSPI